MRANGCSKPAHLSCICRKYPGCYDCCCTCCCECCNYRNIGSPRNVDRLCRKYLCNGSTKRASNVEDPPTSPRRSQESPDHQTYSPSNRKSGPAVKPDPCEDLSSTSLDCEKILNGKSKNYCKEEFPNDNEQKPSGNSEKQCSEPKRENSNVYFEKPLTSSCKNSVEPCEACSLKNSDDFEGNLTGRGENDFEKPPMSSFKNSFDPRKDSSPKKSVDPRKDSSHKKSIARERTLTLKSEKDISRPSQIVSENPRTSSYKGLGDPVAESTPIRSDDRERALSRKSVKSFSDPNRASEHRPSAPYSERSEDKIRDEPGRDSSSTIPVDCEQILRSIRNEKLCCRNICCRNIGGVCGGTLGGSRYCTHPCSCQKMRNYCNPTCYDRCNTGSYYMPSSIDFGKKTDYKPSIDKQYLNQSERPKGSHAEVQTYSPTQVEKSTSAAKFSLVDPRKDSRPKKSADFEGNLSERSGKDCSEASDIVIDIDLEDPPTSSWKKSVNPGKESRPKISVASGRILTGKSENDLSEPSGSVSEINFDDPPTSSLKKSIVDPESKSGRDYRPSASSFKKSIVDPESKSGRDYRPSASWSKKTEHKVSADLSGDSRSPIPVDCEEVLRSIRIKRNTFCCGGCNWKTDCLCSQNIRCKLDRNIEDLCSRNMCNVCSVCCGTLESNRCCTNICRCMKMKNVCTPMCSRNICNRNVCSVCCGTVDCSRYCTHVCSCQKMKNVCTPMCCFGCDRYCNNSNLGCGKEMDCMRSIDKPPLENAEKSRVFHPEVRTTSHTQVEKSSSVESVHK